MPIHFVNFTKDEFLSKKVLHRYMPLEYALKMLNEKALWFANPQIWKDPFEKRFITAKFKSGAKEQDFPWKDKVFCYCSTQTYTSEAYWNTYSRGQVGIEFMINRQVLLNELGKISKDLDVYIGRVEYMLTKNIKKSLSSIPFDPPIPSNFDNEMCARLLLLKRIAFAYEDEVRILIVAKDKSKNKDGIKIQYSCKNTDLIQSITLAPSLEENTTKLFKDVFENKYEFSPVTTSTGHKSRVLKSQLYAEQKCTNINL